MCQRSKILVSILTAVMVMTSMTGCGNTKVDTSTQSVQTEVAEQQEKEQNSQTEQTTIAQVEDTEETKEQEQSSEIQITEDMFSVNVKGTQIELGKDMIVYQETIGEPDDYSAAKSCLGTGEDKTFTYGDVSIYTKPIDGMDKIYLLEITESTSVAGGISIGSTLEELQAVYGKSEDIEGIEHFYALDEKTIGFEIENNEVSFIEIFGED